MSDFGDCHNGGNDDGVGGEPSFRRDGVTLGGLGWEILLELRKL